MIEVRQLTKHYGAKVAVDGLTFTAKPGRVTGFLGPNGAGKSTTMRMIVGMDAPTSGSALVNNKPYAQHRAPLHELGTLLDAKSIHPGRTAYGHLIALAYTHGIHRSRVDQVIDLTGLRAVARKRVGGFSLGMGQRLGIAAALLGDPATLMLDEPINGLDPDGVRWVRQLLRGLAAEGRTVLLSSHLMSEMAQTADDLVIIGRGRLLADTTVEALLKDARGKTVTVVADESARLRELLSGPDITITGDDERLSVTGLDSRTIGQIAARHQIPLSELTPKTRSLEDAFMSLTGAAVEYRTPEPQKVA